MAASIATRADAQSVPTLKVEVPTVTEGETGTIKFTLSQASGKSIDVVYSGGGNSATKGVDYSLAVGTVTFNVGDTSKTVSFTTTDDNTSETPEFFFFFVNGLAADEATIDPSTPPGQIIHGNPTWFVYIQDNDNPANPNVTISAGTPPVTEGAAASFTVTATPAPSANVTVDLDVAQSGAFVASGDLGSKSVTITAGQTSATYTVATEDDNTDESDGSVTVDSGTGYTVGSASSATVTVNDDDSANNTPTVANPIPNQTATTGTSFSYAFPPNTFTDADSDSLTYSALQSDGSALPTWLTFTPGTSTFSGTPQSGDTGMVTVRVTADDSKGGTITDDFDIVVSAPVTTVNVSMAASHGDTDGNVVEGASGTTGYRTITITLSQALTGGQMITVPLTVNGATVATDYTFALQPSSQTGVTLNTSSTHSTQHPAVVFVNGASSATLRLKPVDNSDRSQPYVVIGYGANPRAPTATGVTLGTLTGGPFGVVFVDDETGDIEVPASWNLKPSSLSAGDDFRLLFRSSTRRDATVDRQELLTTSPRS